MMELGILVPHGRARHPRTQRKGERFKRSFADEIRAQRVFSEYRDFHSNQRPHYALDMEVPAKRYTPSVRHVRLDS